MKKLTSTVICCAVSVLIAPAQQLVQTNAPLTAVDSAVSVDGRPADVGPHHRVLRPQGLAVEQPAGNVVEIASGLNFWNGKEWAPSEAALEDTPDGFVALRVQHKLRISHELNVRGAITLMTPQGDVLYSTPVGIGLVDPVDGRFGLIATLTNSTATMVNDREVAFENPFDGVCSTLYYHLERDSFEQDLVFTGKLDPAAWGFSTNCRVQIISEFYSPPTPDRTRRPLYVEQNALVRSRMAVPDVTDDELGFGELVFGSGFAYTMPTDFATNGAMARVGKAMITTTDGRVLLIETVPFSCISDGLLSLPDCGQGDGQARLDRVKRFNGYAAIPKPAKESKLAMNEPLAPALSRGKRDKTALQVSGRDSNLAKRVVANGSWRHPGVTIDYRATLTSSTNLFASDVTYLVSGSLSCGTATIEGGTVLKYKVGASVSVSGIVNKTGPYRPAIFTCVDDDTIGESMNGYTSSGWTGTINTSGYANPALNIGSSSVTLSNCVIRYAQSAVQSLLNGGTISVALAHAQFINCIKGLEITSSGSGTAFGTFNANINNALMAQVRYPLYVASVSFTFNPTLAHCTIDQGSALITGTPSSVAFKSTNSIFANVTNSSSGTFSGANNGFYKALPKFGSTQLGSDSIYPFQSVGAGSYYLSDSAGFRNAGTASGVPPSLQSDLKRRTTYPPLVVVATTITNIQTLSPQAQRDTDTPDLGWHYDPLDYCLGWTVVTNCTLTLGTGTAIGTFGTNSGTYGLAIGRGGALQCVGAPNNLNWITLYNMVQEQPITNWFQPSYASLCSEFQGLTPAAVINCRFTGFSVPAQAVPQFYGPTNSGPFNFQDCEFHGGKLLTVRPTVNLTNCLLERVYTDLEPKDGLTAAFRVGLIYGGAFTFAPSNSVMQDVLFDKAAVTNWNSYSGGFNAYINNFQRLQPTNTSDLVLGSSPAYQTGPLGGWYLLSTATSINWDTNTAANTIGLYHYTVTTNLVSSLQIKETNSWTDVSYHYVATDGSGNPIDTDGDGLPDYFEDTNGNGNANDDLTSWAAYNSTNGLTAGAGLTVFTPLK